MFKRPFHTARPLFSHIGSAPIYLSPEVSCTSNNIRIPREIKKGRSKLRLSQLITVAGPKGTLDIVAPDFIQIEQSEGKLKVSIPNENDKIQKSLWGTMRSIINNHVTGVTEGHLVMLRLQGTGYRAMVEDKDGAKWVQMKVGKCVMQGLPIPKGLSVNCPAPTRIIIEGSDKQQVKLFAGNLRKFHPPEPYKGKGIYIDDETIKLKDKKIS